MQSRTLNQQELDKIMTLIINTQGHLGYANGALDSDDELSDYLQNAAEQDANESLQAIFDIIFNDETSKKEAQEFIKLKYQAEN